MSITGDSAPAQTHDRSVPVCLACGAPGEPLYHDLRDHLFGSPGEWTMRRCPTPDCGLLWLDPAPGPEDLRLAYSRYYTHASDAPVGPSFARSLWRYMQSQYLARRFGYPASGGLPGRMAGWVPELFPARRESLTASIMGLPARPGGRVLDVGCGGGMMLARLRALGWEVAGVDPDPSAARAAAALGIDVRVGTLEEARLEERSFDAIIMNHVIEHVPDPRSVLRECHRILRPGGDVAVSTPNAAGLGHRHFGSAWRGLEPPRHLHVFTPSALRNMATDAGFEILSIRTVAQIAALIYRESLRPDTAASPRTLPWSFTLRTRLFALQERLRLRTDLNAGEEIFLVGRA